MADSVSKTNIPILRTPYSSETPPKVPVVASDDVGSNIQPVYVSNKTIVASDASIGGTTQPVYMNNGEMTACEVLAERTAPSLLRKDGSGTTMDDVPTSPTPGESDPATMIATKEYCDAIGSRATKVTVTPKTTAGSVICVITVDGSEKTIYNGGGGGGGTIETICVPLLTPLWFDHYTSGDTTWLESDCSNDLSADNAHKSSDYPKIYSHLNTEYADSSSVVKTDTYTLTTGTTLAITYKETVDGHKICAVDQRSNLNTIFNDANIGTAWYFVLDTTNAKFHLPRTKYGFNGKFSYAKRPQVKVEAVTSSANKRIGEETMRLCFYTGTGPTSAEKMDKVKSGVGSFTADAVYGNVATFQANNGQVEDSGHGIVNPESPKDTDLVTVDYVTDKLDKKADIDSPTLTGTPKAPTPGSDADSTQIATVGYVKNKAGGGFIGDYLTAKSGGNSSDSGTKMSSYGSYTTENDCFLCWHCIMDSPGAWAGDPNCYIVLNSQAISSMKYAYRANVANDFYFQGPVRKGTTIYLHTPSDVNFHKYSWRAVEFAIS